MRPLQLHFELNARSSVHFSPTKHNVRALRHMVKSERERKSIKVLGTRVPSTFEAFKEYFDSILMMNLIEGHNSGDPLKHLTPDQIISCGLHVDSEANIMFAVVSIFF